MSKKHVLVVVDAQQQYWEGSDAEQRTRLETIASYVSGCRKGEFGLPKADGIVFTRDWLKFQNDDLPYVSKNGEALSEWHNWHSDVLKNLRGEEYAAFLEKKAIFVTKGEDDMFNPVPKSSQPFYDKKVKKVTYVQGRQQRFVIDTTREKPLIDQLDAIAGGSSKATRDTLELIVTGTQLNRCVLKSALHAKDLGYAVTVPLDAVAGNEKAGKFRECWTEAHFEKSVRDAEAHFGRKWSQSTAKKWYNMYRYTAPPSNTRLKKLKNVWDGLKWGAPRSAALGYLRQAGVKVVKTQLKKKR